MKEKEGFYARIELGSIMKKRGSTCHVVKKRDGGKTGDCGSKPE